MRGTFSVNTMCANMHKLSGARLVLIFSLGWEMGVRDDCGKE
jgi:hypothetical protein